MAKRFTKTAINWSEFQKRVPPDQKAQFMTFQSKYDIYMRRMQAYPDKPPEINWELYNKLVPIPGLVKKLKLAYESYKVPFPNDTMTDKVDDQWKVLEVEIKEYCAENQKDIEVAQKELARIKSLPKFEEITMETYYDLYPDDALDPVKRPTFWPHTPDEQEGYKPSPQEETDKGH